MKKKTTRELSNNQESTIAKMLEGRKTANSGATKFDKGDVVSEKYKLLIECKTKAKEQKMVSIKKEWLEGIEEEARAMSNFNEPKIGAVVFDFGEEKKTEANQYIILSLDKFKTLIDLA